MIELAREQCWGATLIYNQKNHPGAPREDQDKPALPGTAALTMRKRKQWSYGHLKTVHAQWAPMRFSARRDGGTATRPRIHTVRAQAMNAAGAHISLQQGSL